MFNLLFEKLATKDNTNKNKEEGKKNDKESDKKEADEKSADGMLQESGAVCVERFHSAADRAAVRPVLYGTGYVHSGYRAGR